jgi:hypothetical protein
VSRDTVLASSGPRYIQPPSFAERGFRFGFAGVYRAPTLMGRGSNFGVVSDAPGLVPRPKFGTAAGCGAPVGGAPPPFLDNSYSPVGGGAAPDALPQLALRPLAR